MMRLFDIRPAHINYEKLAEDGIVKKAVRQRDLKKDRKGWKTNTASL